MSDTGKSQPAIGQRIDLPVAVRPESYDLALPGYHLDADGVFFGEWG